MPWHWQRLSFSVFYGHSREHSGDRSAQQIRGQELRQKFPGPPVRITCPGDLPAKVGASEDCVLRRFGQEFGLTITVTTVTSPTDVNWSWTLGEKLPG
jgi:hypothetical protein